MILTEPNLMQFSVPY